ncbi:hypothetical protein [Bacillus licheniformis]|uniref:hypothetical protein n=1 Tax=Bacillus licheniformis TaxID=1402 RepID=UPI002E24F4D4|nr:hypothetical protein [Bacillus licheniformis]
MFISKKKYEKTQQEIDQLKSDVEDLKKVVHDLLLSQTKRPETKKEPSYLG